VPTDFAAPIDARYFEDYVPGHVHEFGTIAVSEAEIIEFGRRYDPQPFHTDAETARHTQFGGLIASGWQTAGLMMRLVVDHYLSHIASLASPGLDELRWTRPVRPGDTLSIRATVLDAQPSTSKPDRGLVRTFFEVLNQHGDVVMSVKAMNMLKRRDR
jgi:acyl dehydratase